MQGIPPQRGSGLIWEALFPVLVVAPRMSGEARRLPPIGDAITYAIPLEKSSASLTASASRLPERNIPSE